MKREAQSHYQTLNVDRHATIEQIRSAYRRLAKQHHPDVEPKAANDNLFSRIAHAYEVLSDPKTRAAYDLELEQTELRSRRHQAAPGTSHYSWENIAQAKNSHASDRPLDLSELDEIYDTFFHERNAG